MYQPHKMTAFHLIVQAEETEGEVLFPSWRWSLPGRLNLFVPDRHKVSALR